MELEKEKITEEKEMERLLAELKDTHDALEISKSRLNSVTERLPDLEARVLESEEREKEAIRISNDKDPQVEELGKWYVSKFFFADFVYSTYQQTFM